MLAISNYPRVTAPHPPGSYNNHPEDKLSAVKKTLPNKTRLGGKLPFGCWTITNPPRNDSFSQVPEIDFHHETEARKVMVDFKFDAPYGKSS